LKVENPMQNPNLKPSTTRRSFLVKATALAASGAVFPAISRGLGGWQKKSSNPAVPRLATNDAIVPLNYSKVTVTDQFWKSKQERVANATLPACIVQTEAKTARIRNFEKVTRGKGEKHEGIYYDDSDVYKAIEAIAYSLQTHPNSALESKVDDWIRKIAAAQLPDGYLNTYFTLNDLDHRWTDMEKHEDYCAGHLIEAAVAYYRTTGKRSLMDVAIRFANHIDETFRLPNRHWVSGHEEIELALMKLFDVTRDERYLKLAGWYLDQRGRGYGRGALWAAGRNADYCQDSVPVKDQREITGHAVRAMYLYCGAADVAAATRDAGYVTAMKTVWEDVVYRNMYLTGGIGSSGQNEGFSQDYDLPNADAYCETCASVGMVLWNQRMNSLTGEGKYIDVLERSLYNGALDGLSISGDKFFYGNPLASSTAFSSSAVSGHRGRSEWFGTACCPANIARLVASVAGYIYAASEGSIWVNLFIGNSATIQTSAGDVALDLKTEYPWKGNFKLKVNPDKPMDHALRIRIPGWLQGEPVPGGLYSFEETNRGRMDITVDGKPLSYREENGYAVLERSWNKGDVVEASFPMEVRKVRAREEVAANRGRFALQRGPLVYCVEGADNEGRAWDFVMPESSFFRSSPHQILQEQVIALRSDGLTVMPASNGLGAETKRRSVTAIPYYAWANRDNYEMQVWLPTKIQDLKINT
jgi:DUF1680 family protein